jgi:hypothetical protein
MALGLGCRATTVTRPGLITCMYMTDIEVVKGNDTRRNASSRAVLCKINNPV